MWTFVKYQPAYFLGGLVVSEDRQRSGESSIENHMKYETEEVNVGGREIQRQVSR